MYKHLHLVSIALKHYFPNYVLKDILKDRESTTWSQRHTFLSLYSTFVPSKNIYSVTTIPYTMPGLKDLVVKMTEEVPALVDLQSRKATLA